MQSAVQISNALHRYIHAIEEELGVPIRLLSGGGGMCVVSQGTVDLIDRDYGYYTQNIGNPQWERQLRHTRGETGPYPSTDYESGVTLVTTGAPFITRSGHLDDEFTIAEGEMARVNNRMRELGIQWVLPEYEADAVPNPELDNAEVQEFHFAGSDTAYAWAYREIDGFTGSLVIYPFSFEQMRAETFDRDRLLREPITAAVGESGGTDEEKLARYKQRFVEFSAGRIGRRILEARQQVAVFESQAHDAMERYRSALDQLREQKITLDTLIRMRQGDGGIDPDVEWERLLDHKMVKEVRVSSGRFQIFTTELEMLDPDTRDTYPLGEFKITFPMAPGSGTGVTMRNLTNRKTPGDGLPQRDHPHVENERPCFGSLMSEVARLSATGEVGGMVEVALQYLQTFNPQDDYGRYAGLWGVSRDGDVEDGETWDRSRE